MERRDFLKIALGVVAGAAAMAASARAAPLSPQALAPDGRLPANPEAHPAVTSGDEVDRLKPEEVRWGYGRHRGWGHRGWGHRHWGWRRHRHWGWRRRHWGWRRRHWGWHRRRRWYRRHYWRRRYW
jgi:hypothetical protein